MKEKKYSQFFPAINLSLNRKKVSLRQNQRKKWNKNRKTFCFVLWFFLRVPKKKKIWMKNDKKGKIRRFFTSSFLFAFPLPENSKQFSFCTSLQMTSLCLIHKRLHFWFGFWLTDFFKESFSIIQWCQVLWYLDVHESF